ncbi:MAG: ribosome-associated translation inhibitor RaiA [Phycisphaerales bacterium]|nr:MAG: ribosome-associated translation inhibitor RaiA [Phycisphaerales bacterium]
MQISVIGRHVDITDEIRSYAQEKGAKLPRFYDRVSSIEFVLDHESDHLTAEVIVKADRTHEFVARETGSDPAALIDVIVEKMERQLKKHKEKSRNHRHGGAKDVTGEP